MLVVLIWLAESNIKGGVFANSQTLFLIRVGLFSNILKMAG